MKRRDMKGAAIVPIALSTQRALLGFRSKHVDNPSVWAPFGGHREPGEMLLDTAVRELKEETGYRGPMVVWCLAPGFYVARVPFEFDPVLNWEHEDARWFDLDTASRLVEKKLKLYAPLLW